LESLAGKRSSLVLKKFKTAKKSLGNLDAETAGELRATAADSVLIIDKKGVSRDVAFPAKVCMRSCTATNSAISARMKINMLVLLSSSPIPARDFCFATHPQGERAVAITATGGFA
jgi:hypothetical protein